MMQDWESEREVGGEHKNVAFTKKHRRGGGYIVGQRLEHKMQVLSGAWKLLLLWLLLLLWEIASYTFVRMVVYGFP